MSKITQEAVREIERIHSRWIEFETAAAHDRLMALCSNDIEFWPPDAPALCGRAAVSAWIARGTAKIQLIEIFHRRIRGSNELAYLTATYKTTFSSGEDPTPKQTRGSHLWILRKQCDKWVVSLVNWTSWF